MVVHFFKVRKSICLPAYPPPVLPKEGQTYLPVALGKELRILSSFCTLFWDQPAYQTNASHPESQTHTCASTLPPQKCRVEY